MLENWTSESFGGTRRCWRIITSGKNKISGTFWMYSEILEYPDNQENGVFEVSGSRGAPQNQQIMISRKNKTYENVGDTRKHSDDTDNDDVVDAS